MTKKLLLVLVALPFVPGCTDDSSASTKLQTCQINEKLYEGRCYDINECLPACAESTQKCIKGTCYDKKECVPECNNNTQKCADGTCISKNECYPACNAETHVCNNGTCEPIDPTACVGKQCKNISTYCDETGHWNNCQAGYGCHLGHCLKGLAPECSEGMCSDDGTRECQGGTWVSCGSMESCVNGNCVLSDVTCQAPSCSEDEAYRCTGDNTYEACPVGTKCNAGECEDVIEPVDAMLWKSCRTNADCSRGVCVFEVSSSRTMSVAQLGIKDADTVPLYVIDPRVELGTGVCSADCTRDASICDLISTETTKFTCQIIVTGDSPYPPKDEYLMDLSLPFHKQLDLDDMNIAPYGAICRPNDPKEKVFSKTFCNSCSTSSDCTGAEVCLLNMCVQPCSDDSQCPYSFSCQKPENMESSYCMPNAGTCGSCIDKDGDGMGYGLCSNRGFDCDDLNPDIYYKKELDATKCTDNYTDDNCNGQIDKLELLGQPDNCDACGSTCKVDENASHIDRQCELNNGGLALDDSTVETVENTYVYGCFDYCGTGYADCDNDVSNGCETQLFAVDANGDATITDDAVLYTLDRDKDGHGVIDSGYAHFCCKSNQSVCYAMPQTHANVKNFWDRAVLHEDSSYSSLVDDCDDSLSERFPGNPEICDGIDNDCNDATPDGHDALAKLQNNKYVSASSTDSGKLYALNDTCTLYEVNTGNVCNPNGTIKCMASTTETGISYDLVCNASTSLTDGATCNGENGEDCCNGIDDNCNGLIDEDFVMTACSTNKSGICNMGVSICAGPKNIVCQQLYEPRPYDFYGDNIDSDCDGVDWDTDKAVYVEKWGKGLYDGSDDHSGGPDGPLDSLSKAFDKAKSSIDGTSFYKDILVSKNVVNQTDANAKWGKSPISVPTLSAVYNPNLNPVITHAQHVQNYINAIKNSATYKANDYLYPGEVYPARETVRVYGGFEANDGNWTPPNSASIRSTYQYFVNSSLTNQDKSLKNNHYELVNPLGANPLSVRFDHFNLTIEPSDKVFSKQSGTTFVGINCGRYGCKDLAIVNTTVFITGAKGLQAEQTFPSNNNWQNAKNGVDSDHFNVKNGGGKNYAANYDNNACMSMFYSNGWNLYSNYDTYYTQTCPDGSIPRGGCGAGHCCSSGCSGFKQTSYGRYGYGSNGGTGADVGGTTKSHGCDSNKSVDKSKAAGGLGKIGAGGAGGNNSKLTMKFYFAADDVYVATYSGNVKDSTTAADGSPGIAGGGGGGGGIYHCYDRDGTYNSWGFAGSGGAGGCGGYGGKAGGTGGSGIGLVLIPPKSINSNITLTGSNIVVNGANGGFGHQGQDGVVGGLGGKSHGYAAEACSGCYDQHCFKGTAGGSGAPGGGGGGGAGGLGGHAYGIMFLCNRSVSDYNGVADLAKCGFSVDHNFLASPDRFTSVTGGLNVANGKDGTAGSWLANSDTSADKNAKYQSTQGIMGVGGIETTNKNTSEGFVMPTTNAF